MMELGLLLLSIVIMFIIVVMWMVDRSNLQDTIYKYERKISYLEKEKYHIYSKIDDLKSILKNRGILK
ncbi:hypothetical protein [Clostridium sp. UBA4395]|uniref:hypothetical protein n=1 Tax=Clostridium sp. UBA4395 TaxID=1946360 RepID=UPI0032168D72